MDWERERILVLPPDVRWLFFELVLWSNFKTGAGSTSWARIMAVLDWDRAPTGPRRPAITLRQARKAVEDFEALGVLARDKRRNEAQGALLFHVHPRVGFGVPAPKLGRESGRGVAPQKPRKTRAKPVTEPANLAGNRAGVPEGITTPLPPVNGKLPTGAARLPTGQVLERLQAMRPRGKTRPPKGG